jgi:hypothetical protein
MGNDSARKERDDNGPIFQNMVFLKEKKKSTGNYSNLIRKNGKKKKKMMM